LEVERHDGTRAGHPRTAPQVCPRRLGASGASAVQVEQHAVERGGGAQVGEQPGLRRLVEVRADTPGRRGGRGERRHERHAPRRRRVDHAAQAGAGVPVGLEDLAAVPEVAGLELAPVRRDRAERVRLVREHRDEEPHRASLWRSAA
jgi:hypothetical protein